MILVENVETYGWEAALRGMRNPLNSWEKADSNFKNGKVEIGPNDLNLMRRLSQSGPVHGKFLRMIGITLDLTAPLFFYKEFDTYKVGTVRNSCSTMHKIMAKPFVSEDFSFETLIAAALKSQQNYEDKFISTTLDMLNYLRDSYLVMKNKNPDAAKAIWRELIEALPSSYNQKSTISFNYEVARNMYFYRKNHKLYEWRTFCKELEKLPYSEFITTPYKMTQ